ncbi:PPPDE putative peptidase domain-containing protein [Xylariales sp. PMI_506]|nr:PPPDE putative peptidase domain-containing protein [Xylariales sp. PMI_506]
MPGSKKSGRHSTSGRPSRQSSHRSTLSLSRTEILINVYDLLPPGHLSSFLWTLGSSLLHTGVVINGREYAYGGHDRSNTTGVYWTPPRTVPPGGSFRMEILHGFTFATEVEIDAIIKRTSEDFQGTSYNLLTKNCNHFTQTLCERLTGRRGPTWLNRAAQIGVALPCVVPRDWLEPPDYATADGALLDVNEEDEDESLNAHEGTGFLHRENSYQRGVLLEEGRARSDSGSKGKGRATATKDSSGRPLPPAERAPTHAIGSSD